MSAISMHAAAAEVELIGVASIPGDAIDRSSLTDTLAGDVPHNRLGGFGSAIAWTGKDHRYLALPDRGPADGATDYQCRVQVIDIAIDADAGVDSASPQRLRVDVRQTIMLTQADGSPLVGSLKPRNDAHPGDVFLTSRFDPEGLAIGTDGSIYVSDEYGPCVDRFALSDARAARRVERMLPPRRFINPMSSGEPAREMPPHSTFGRQANRGMEGLTITPDGGTLVGIMQSPLLQDGALDDNNKRAGRNIRMLLMPLDGRPTREFVYRLESPSSGVNEILAITDDEFLVLERDGRAGAAATARGLFTIDIRNATDVSNVTALPRDQLPVDIAPVSKKALIDFTDARFGLAGESMPEKIEGMTWGPNLADGRRLLIVTSDNDFVAETPSWVWAFAVRLD